MRTLNESERISILTPTDDVFIVVCIGAFVTGYGRTGVAIIDRDPAVCGAGGRGSSARRALPIAVPLYWGTY